MSRGKKSNGNSDVIEVVEPQTFEAAISLLKPKHQAFVLEYVKEFNGAEAARKAGYSEKGARITAQNILSNPIVSHCLRLFLKERRENSTKTVEDVEKRLEQIGFSDITDIISFTRDGLTMIKESDQLSPAAKAALKSVEFSENLAGISVKVSMHDQIAALKLLGLQKGMFKQGMDLNVMAETYEQKRKRLGLDELSPEEAWDKFRAEHEAKLMEKWANSS
ncbi:MAG: terminase small subunit [Thermodesulfovibrionales bacterium]